MNCTAAGGIDLKSKNGSNGRANSLHMMENGGQNGSGGGVSPSGSASGILGKVLACRDGILRWRRSIIARWEKFKMDRSEYSLWLFKPNHP